MGTRFAKFAAGPQGAVAAADSRAVGAALEVYKRGGNAVDAAVAAQAVLCVVMPQACGLGGDSLALLRTPDGVTAFTGTGTAPAGLLGKTVTCGASVTVPGAVAAWQTMLDHAGTLALADVLEPAIELATVGVAVDPALHEAVGAQRPRLRAGGALDWDLLGLAVGEVWRQPALAGVLADIAAHGASAFYQGRVADAVVAACVRHGGAMSVDDLHDHRTVVGAPIEVRWADAVVHVQPPPSQGVLLAMALRWLATADWNREHRDHVGVELVEAVFGYRDRVGRDGAALLGEPLSVDPSRAAKRGGPRPYLHTAGVASADASGMVVSSLVSVFDHFGSAIYVEPGGFVLNNRAEGFTTPPNDAAPGKRPVHTLAPCLMSTGSDWAAVATPGADGQVQTLLQVLSRLRYDGEALPAALTASRWRSEGGQVLVGADHQAADALRRRGHDVIVIDDGDERLGAVVAAGVDSSGVYAAGDWRRDVAVGAR